MSTNTASTQPQTPPPPSFLQIMDTRKSAELASDMGLPYSQEEKVKLDELLRRYVGANNGGVLNGGLDGGALTLFDQCVYFLQCLPRIFSGDMKFEDAFKPAAAEASDFATSRALQRGLIQMNIAMREAGGNLAATADAVTGQFQVGADRTVLAAYGNDPRSLSNQALNARNINSNSFANNNSLTINPAQQPEHVTVVVPQVPTQLAAMQNARG